MIEKDGAQRDKKAKGGGKGSDSLRSGLCLQGRLRNKSKNKNKNKNKI